MEERRPEAAAAASEAAKKEDEETSETVEDGGWVRAVQQNVDRVATDSNTRYTKVLVLTDENQDKNFQTLKRYSKTKRIFFMQEPLSGPGWDKEANKMEESKDSRKAFLERVEKHNPSVLIIASEHYPATLPVLRDFYGKSFIREKPLVDSSDFFIVETRNRWQLESCILTCTTVAVKVGPKMKQMKREGQMNNDDDTVLVTGGHGTSEDKEGKKTSHGGLSGFTQVNMLDNSLYEKDCKSFSYPAVPDPCEYNEEGKVIGIKEGTVAPAPEYVHSKFLNNQRVSVLNIAHYHNNLELLVEHLTLLQPKHLVINWCFSTNDDLAQALRSSGMFSKLLIEFDLRRVTGKSDVKLNRQQEEFLKQMVKAGLFNVILSGSSGTTRPCVTLPCVTPPCVT